MVYREQTLKKWKFVRLFGRLLALIGLALVGYAILNHNAQADAWGGFGILLIGVGLVSAWTGRIASYWFYG